MRIRPRISSIRPRSASSRKTRFTVGRFAPASSAIASCVSVISTVPLASNQSADGRHHVMSESDPMGRSTSSSSRSRGRVHADWLAQRGEGFHHVAYIVDSLAALTGEMEAAGHPPIARIHSFGADGDGSAAYFDTDESLGFLVEAVEPPAAMPAADYTYA